MKSINLNSKIVRSENFIAATVDDDIVMMSIEKGSYFSLDDIGSQIWEKMFEPILVSNLCAQLISQFNVEQAQCETDVLAFLSELAAEDMVQLV